MGQTSVRRVSVSTHTRRWVLCLRALLASSTQHTSIEFYWGNTPGFNPQRLMTNNQGISVTTLGEKRTNEELTPHQFMYHQPLFFWHFFWRLPAKISWDNLIFVSKSCAGHTSREHCGARTASLYRSPYLNREQI